MVPLFEAFTCSIIRNLSSSLFNSNLFHSKLVYFQSRCCAGGLGKTLAPPIFLQNWNCKYKMFIVWTSFPIIVWKLHRWQCHGTSMWRSSCVWLSNFFLVTGYVFTGLVWLVLLNQNKLLQKFKNYL